MANAPFKRGDIVKHSDYPDAIAIVVMPNESRWGGCVGINWVSGNEVQAWRNHHPDYDFACRPNALTVLTEMLDD